MRHVKKKVHPLTALTPPFSLGYLAAIFTASSTACIAMGEMQAAGWLGVSGAVCLFFFLVRI